MMFFVRDDFISPYSSSSCHASIDFGLTRNTILLQSGTAIEKTVGFIYHFTLPEPSCGHDHSNRRTTKISQQFSLEYSGVYDSRMAKKMTGHHLMIFAALCFTLGGWTEKFYRAWKHTGRKLIALRFQFHISNVSCVQQDFLMHIYMLMMI